jgi:hypothetical protein
MERKKKGGTAMIRASHENQIVMEIETDPVELAKARARWERFDQNWACLQAHVPQVYEGNRGKTLCIAGQELFVADTVEEALAQAKAAHPDDDGCFTLYIPRERMARIYAHTGRMVS